MRKTFDISAYLVIGPENAKGSSAAQIVSDVVEAGFTCIQIRSKTASALELINLTKQAADVIANAGKSDRVALLVNDRLDVVLAARMQNIKVDGIHVGQTDIPIDVCRKYLGENSIVGVTAASDELQAYIQTTDVSQIDYFGIGPLRETATKPDCGLSADGKIITRDFDEIKKLTEISSAPLVVGGGVMLADLPSLAQTGVDGFFVVSAITAAPDPKAVAEQMVAAWKSNKGII